MTSYKKILSTLLAAVVAFSVVAPATASAKDKFRVAWSIYVGWMPYGWGTQQGIFDKWADKYGIEIEVVQINDYIESINQFTAGAFDATTMTNMDALTIPAAGGVDSTALLIGDFSNGNDGLVLKGEGAKLESIKGQNVNLVELSVSHYLLARALESVGMTERDVTVVNTADADITSAFGTDDITAVVTWNPMLAEINALPNASPVFDSSDIPGEIIDMLVVNTETLEANPAFGKAMAGAWYEILSIMNAGDEAATAALTSMAEASGTDLAGYQAQLDSTQMFYNPADAVAFAESQQLIDTMKSVSQFSFDHGLLGEGAPDAEFIGMTFPGGKTFGNTGNTKLRFNAEYMKMAAEGKL